MVPYLLGSFLVSLLQILNKGGYVMKMRIFCPTNNERAFEIAFKFGSLVGLCLAIYIWFILGLGGPEHWLLWIRYSVQVAMVLSFVFLLQSVWGFSLLH